MEQTVNGDESPHGEEAQSPQPKKEELKKIGNFIVGKLFLLTISNFQERQKARALLGKLRPGRTNRRAKR